MILGIDPGIGKTGLALVEKGLLFRHKTMRGDDALKYVIDLHRVYRFDRAIIERPKESVFYSRHMMKSNAIQNARGMIKLAQNVGMNIRLTDEFCSALKSCGVSVHDTNPRRGNTKWDISRWCSVFNWSGRPPSEHARDAAVLAMLFENWGGWSTCR